MQLQILGAHKLESSGARFVSLLIDDVLAVEAGALAGSLSIAAQQQLAAVLLTHRHYDHVRDIPSLGMNFSLHAKTLDVYAIRPVAEALQAQLLNGVLYPDFTQRPEEKPSIRLRVIEPGREEIIGGYRVLAVPVNHSVPAVGYQITDGDGTALFYTADTGPGLADTWRQIAPKLLVIEVTAPDRYEDFARRSGHLTPALLQQELASFREVRGYLPPMVLVHMNPLEEAEIEAEIAGVARSLEATIQLGYEGMKIRL